MPVHCSSSILKVIIKGVALNVSDLLENRQIDRPFSRRVARCDYNCKICNQGRFIQFCISRSVPPLFILRMRSGNNLRVLGSERSYCASCSSLLSMRSGSQ